MGSYTVYMHITPSEKRYVGITSRSPKDRWGYNGSGYKGQAFENAIRKYGWDNIEHKILYMGLSKEDAEQKEIELIAFYRTTDDDYGYNVQNGGSSVGKFTEQSRRKISESRKGKPAWNKGIPRTEEEKRKMSRSHVGKTKGKNNGNYGKSLSDEHRRKISEAKKGHIAYWEGKHLPEEAKRKISKARSKEVVRIEDGRHYPSITIASKESGITSAAICNCLKGKTMTAGGYHWEYAQTI